MKELDAGSRLDGPAHRRLAHCNSSSSGISTAARRGRAAAARWLSGCAWRCWDDSRTARDHVRVARALPALPLIRAAFASGQLTYSKVRALTRVATPESEADLLEFARHATAAQLDRSVRGAHRAVSADSVEAHEESNLSWCWSDDNKYLELTARIPAEDGAIFLEALETAREALHEQRRAEASEDGENGPAEPLEGEVAGSSAEPPRCGSAECLTAVAEAALAHIPAVDGARGGDRHQVMVHIDAETLATDSPGAQATGRGTCSVARGPGIAPEVVRRICATPRSSRWSSSRASRLRSATRDARSPPRSAAR